MTSDFGGENCSFGLLKFSGFPANTQARAIFILGDDVKVDVEHGLVGEFAVVLQDVVRLRACGGENCSRDAGEGAADCCCRLVVELVECCDFTFGDDERVAFAQREDVEERKDVRIFVDLVGGDFASDDFGEDGGHGGA